MFWNLLKKELKEVLTISGIVSIVALSVVYAFIGKTIGNIEEQVTKKPTIAIVNLDEGYYAKAVEEALSNAAHVVYLGKDYEEALQAVKQNNGAAVLVIEENFSNDILSYKQGKIKIVSYIRGLGIMDTVSSAVISGLVESIKKQLTYSMAIQHGVSDPAFLLEPIAQEPVVIFQDRVYEKISPSQLVNIASSQSTTTSVIVMMLIIMAGTTVISSMGLEKENKTLETLMTMPVKRGYIVFAKILAGAISGVIMAGIYMIGFSSYMRAVSMSIPQELGLSVTPFEYGLVGLSLFSALICGIALGMLLGILSKDYKSAQTMTFPLVALALVSMFLTMFKDFGTLSTPLKVAVFAIPFTHPMLSLRNMLFDNYSFTMLGILYNTILAVFLMSVIIKIFNSDKLITGVISKKRPKVLQ
ncbi:ABC transporter permease [Pseudothermotoga thermarum]|uniref:ABC-2 type transporter n=1 Tax=Pseudothermotoga thermarum DSM 5069 TaxID=688269 RepID=F7YV10_9THEM|nr:ABC transporter permease [Pseudothermotoga thermarum]AEH50294.1 ABC-2 type transporter [Pseudothermotoga thermarum DSM 5069]